MSEHEGGESKSKGEFLLAWLACVLGCVEFSGVFFVMEQRRTAAAAHRAKIRALDATMRARIEQVNADLEATRVRVLRQGQDR
jgi:hypothetical protein